jgi:dissimilatory sulfite reductase (desulfoviridin) alpha/beta subunit
MSILTLPSEDRECIESIVLSIYTDMVNSGASLQETLAAVYLSGCENALVATKAAGGEG